MVHGVTAGLVRRSIWVMAAVSFAYLPLPVAAAGSNYAACPACGNGPAVWSSGEFDQVHLVAAPAATNQHPQALSTEGLAKALAALRIARDGGLKPLLDGDGATRMAQGIASALAKATPGQDAIFLATTSTGGSGLFATVLGHSGRAFVDANGLNIVFAEADVDFVGQYRGTRHARAFDFGSRAAASNVRLAADGFSHPRHDWVVMPLAAIRAGAAPRMAGDAPAPRDEQYYAAQEIRLKSLKRLRDQNLIGEDEYRAKKQEILKDW